MKKFLNDRSTSNIWRTSTHELKVFARVIWGCRFIAATTQPCRVKLTHCCIVLTLLLLLLSEMMTRGAIAKKCLNTLSMEVRSESRRRVQETRNFNLSTKLSRASLEIWNETLRARSAAARAIIIHNLIKNYIRPSDFASKIYWKTWLTIMKSFSICHEIRFSPELFFCALLKIASSPLFHQSEWS